MTSTFDASDREFWKLSCRANPGTFDCGIWQFIKQPAGSPSTSIAPILKTVGLALDGDALVSDGGIASTEELTTTSTPKTREMCFMRATLMNYRSRCVNRSRMPQRKLEGTLVRILAANGAQDENRTHDLRITSAFG